MLLAVISHSNLIPQEYGLRIILLPFIPSDWTLHAFGMSGVLTSLLMQKYADREHPRKFIVILCALGVIMLIAALCSHPHWIISKIQATPSWLFYCLAAFFPLFGLFYWLTDVKVKHPGSISSNLPGLPRLRVISFHIYGTPHSNCWAGTTPSS